MKSYVVTHLNNNESLVAEARKHWFSLFPAVVELCAAFVVIGLAGGIAELFSALPPAPQIVKGFLWLVAAVLVYAAFRGYFLFFSTELGFSDKRLIGKVGLIRVRSLLTPLNKINNVSGYSGFFGRIFNYGSVQVYSSSGQFVYDYIVGHDDFITRLMDQIDAYEKELQNLGGGAAKEPAARGPRLAAPDPAPAADLDFERDRGGGLGLRGLFKKRQDPAPEEAPEPAAAATQGRGTLRAAPRAAGAAPQKAGDGGKNGKEEPKASSQSISFCPYCKAPYSVTPEMDGKLSQCKKCKKQFVIKVTDFA
jgi:membrane protein YdbS with pleckstrin-like domain